MRRGIPTLLLIVLMAGVFGLWAWSMANRGPVEAPEDKPATRNAAASTGPIRVMSANVRMLEQNDGENAWSNRRAGLVKTLLKYGPDIIGCQEVTPAQGAFLTKELGTWYEHYPKSTGGGLVGTVNATFAAMNTIFYRAERFEAVDGAAGLILPDELQSDASENAFHTMVVLREKQEKDPMTLIVVDTHLRHQPSFAFKCAVKLRQRIGEMAAKYPGAPVVVMGDMNHDRNTTIYAALAGSETSADGAGRLTDCFDYASRGPIAWGTYHAFTGRPQSQWPTDLIFTSSGLSFKGTEIVRDSLDGKHFPSDHFFVLTDLGVKAVGGGGR